MQYSIEISANECYNYVIKNSEVGFMEIGKRIKAIRLKLLMSQTEFASLLGVSFATVNRWENGKTEPSYRALRKLEEICKEKDITF